jgi:hypothetical protein
LTKTEIARELGTPTFYVVNIVEELEAELNEKAPSGEQLRALGRRL